jgi:hypothetical protein
MTANNHVNDTNDLLQDALSHQHQDTRLRMPLPPSQQNIPPPFFSDATDLTRQRELEHSILSQVSDSYNVNDTSVVPQHAISHLKKDDGLHMSLPPSQRPFTSDSEEAELIQQIQFSHFILSQASASNRVKYARALLLHAFDRQSQGAHYNQLIQNALDRIIRSSSMIPAQQLNQQNYQDNNFASAASSSDAIANAQARCGTSASMKRPSASLIIHSSSMIPV